MKDGAEGEVRRKRKMTGPGRKGNGQEGRKGL